MEEEKNYVGMSDCFLCGQPKEILLDRRLKNTLPRNAVYDEEPCDKCKEWMGKGIIFIGVRDGEQQSDNPYRTGHFFVLRDEAVKRMPMSPELKEQILKKRVCFIELGVMAGLGILEKVNEEAKNAERI